MQQSPVLVYRILKFKRQIDADTNKLLPIFVVYRCIFIANTYFSVIFVSFIKIDRVVNKE